MSGAARLRLEAAKVIWRRALPLPFGAVATTPTAFLRCCGMHVVLTKWSAGREEEGAIMGQRKEEEEEQPG